MQKRAIVFTVIMALLLMASCDPPGMKPATTTTTDDATTTTTTDDATTTTVADTGTVATENPQSVQSEDQSVVPEDPALTAAKTAAVTAAKAVQAKVENDIKSNVDSVEDTYQQNDLRTLNANNSGFERRELTVASLKLENAKVPFTDLSETGIGVLSQKAVEAANAVKALTSSEKADDAVAKAEAVKTAVDKTDDPSVQFALTVAINEVDATTPLANENAKIADLDAIRAVKTLVDALKQLADDAVAAAQAVQ